MRENEYGFEAEVKMEAIQNMKLYLLEKGLLHCFLHFSLQKVFEDPCRCGLIWSL